MSKKDGSLLLQSVVTGHAQRVHWVSINTDETQLVLDSACRQLLQEANFLAAFKARNIKSLNPQRYSEFDWLQQPILGYKNSKSQLCVFSGLFSYQQAIVHQLTTVPVFIYEKAPPPQLRRKAALAELTRLLLDQQPSSGVEQLRDRLCSWFKTTEGKKAKTKSAAANCTENVSGVSKSETDTQTTTTNTSHISTAALNKADEMPASPRTTDIFNSEEWKSLYPGIKNKAQFCAWQGISSKTFRDKNDD